MTRVSDPRPGSRSEDRTDAQPDTRPTAASAGLTTAGGTAESSPQAAAAMAARARLERLLAAPAPFAEDDGSVRPEVSAALEVTGLPRHEYLDRLWAALAGGRLIVPVAAHAMPSSRPSQSSRLSSGGGGPQSIRLSRAGAGPEAPAHEVHTADACQDAASLAVSLPDGHIALPVFTSAQAMSAWRADVRPVPVEPVRAARVACLSTDQLWVLDPGGRDLRLPRPAVVALAGGEDWVPSWRSTLIQDELTAQLSGLEGVTAVAFAPGQASELRILLRVDASAGRGAVADTLAACQEVLVNPAWGELIDTVELVPLPA